MASIPQDFNKTQIGFTSAPSSGKSSPDAGPFVLALAASGSNQPKAPASAAGAHPEESATHGAPDSAGSVAASDSSDKAVHQSELQDNGDSVQSRPDEKPQNDLAPAVSDEDGAAGAPDDTEDKPDEIATVDEEIGSLAVAALLDPQPDLQSADTVVEKRATAVNSFALDQNAHIQAAGDRAHQHPVEKTTLLAATETVLANSSQVDQNVKNGRARARLTERAHTVSTSGEAKAKKSRKAARDTTEPPTDVRQAETAKADKTAPVQQVAASDNSERATSRGKRTPPQQTSITAAAAPPAAIQNKTDVAQPTAALDTNVVRYENNNSEAAPGATSQAAAQSGPATAPRLHDHLVPRASRKAGDTVTLNQADTNRFLQRVTRAFDAAKNRDGEIRLRLSPPELGSLRLEVRLQQGGLVARLETETPATRTLLIDNLPVLRERLAEQGVHIEQFDVDLLDRHDQSNFQDPRRSPEDHVPRQQHHGSVARSPTTEAANLADTPEIPLTAISKRINVII